MVRRRPSVYNPTRARMPLSPYRAWDKSILSKSRLPRLQTKSYLTHAKQVTAMCLAFRRALSYGAANVPMIHFEYHLTRSRPAKYLPRTPLSGHLPSPAPRTKTRPATTTWLRADREKWQTTTPTRLSASAPRRTAYRQKKWRASSAFSCTFSSVPAIISMPD